MSYQNPYSQPEISPYQVPQQQPYGYGSNYQAHPSANNNAPAAVPAPFEFNNNAYPPPLQGEYMHAPPPAMQQPIPQQQPVIPQYSVPPGSPPPQLVPNPQYVMPAPTMLQILVAPFNINEEKAHDIFSEWKKDLFFAPSDFLELVSRTPVQAMFVPFWSFEVDLKVRFVGRAAWHVHPTTQPGQTTQTGGVQRRYQNASGETFSHQKDLLACASALLNEKLFTQSNIGSFDVKKAVPQLTDQSLPAPKPWNDVWDKEIISRIKHREIDACTSKIRHDFRCQEVDSVNVYLEYLKIEATQVYLPVYTTQYKYEDKLYVFLINGQTGKVYGEKPFGGGGFKKGLKSIGSLFSLKDFKPAITLGTEMNKQNKTTKFKDNEVYIAFPPSYSFLGSYSCGHIVLKNTSSKPVQLLSYNIEKDQEVASVILQPNVKMSFNYRGSWSIRIVDGDEKNIAIVGYDRKIAGGESNDLKMA